MNTAPITPEQIKYLHLLVVKCDLVEDKKHLVSQYTNGRTESSKEMTQTEARYLIASLKKMVSPTEDEKKADRMRRKIIGLAHECGWHLAGTQRIDMERLDNWCLNSSYLKKKLDKYKLSELPRLVSQFEKVHAWNTKIERVDDLGNKVVQRF